MAAESDRVAVPAWVRYGGLAAILGAILETAVTFSVGALFPEAFEPGTRDALLVGDLVVTYLVLGVVGAVAVYGRYGDALGWTGNLGLLAIAVGAVVGVAVTVLTGIVATDLLNLLLVYGGAALLAVGLWRIPSVPRSAAALMGLSPVLVVAGIVAVLLAPGSLVGPVTFVVLSLVWGAAWIVLGYHLWRSPRGTAGTARTGTTGT